MKPPKVTPPTPPTPAIPATALAASTPRWAIGLALLGIVALFLTLSMQRIWASDLWWQLRTGQYILEHGFPITDALSYTVPNNAWVELRWLFCVTILKLYELGGATLLIVFESAMLAAAFGIYAWHCRKAVLLPLGTLALALGIMTAYQRFVVRPELVTYLLMAVFIVTLDARRKGGARRMIWALPVLQVLWVNAHTLFVFGPVIACAFAGADTLSRWWRLLTAPDATPRGVGRTKKPAPAVDRPRAFDIPLCVAALLVVAACFVNPWGVDGVTFPLILLEETRPGHILAKSIEEFTSPFFGGQWGPAYAFGCALAVIGGVTFALNWRRTDLARVFLWSAHVYFAATSTRNLGIFGFVGVWAVLANLNDLARHAPRPLVLFNPTRRLRTAGHVIVAAASLVTAWSILTERFLSQHQEPRPFSFGTMRSITPTAATDFLLSSGAKPQLFHSMRDASYLTWAAHEKYKVYVDGRLEVYTADFIASFLGFLGKDWDRFANESNINVVMVNREEFGLLTSRLVARPEWVLVYLDDIQTIWVRDIPEHADLITRHRIDPAKAWIPKGVEPSESIGGWRSAIGARAFPWYSMGMARQFLALGAAENAGAYLERAHQTAPWYPDARLMLAQIERWQGNEPRATELLKDAGLSRAQLAGGDRMFADLLITSGRETEAIAPLERCIDHYAKDPGGYALFAKLARAYAAANRLPDAARAFRQASQLAPRVVEYHENLAIVLAAQGDRAGAKRAYEQALNLDPRRPDLLVALGELLTQLGSPQDARKCFEYALRIQPDYAPARNAMQQFAQPTPR